MSSLPKLTRQQLNSEARTLRFITCATYYNLFHSRCSIKHSLADGVFFTSGDRTPLNKELIDKLDQAVREEIKTPIEFLEIPREDLLKYFQDNNMKDKIGVLKTLMRSTIRCAKRGDYIDYILEPTEAQIPPQKKFALHPYENGFILRLPTITSQYELNEWIDPHAQLAMFNELTEWAKLIKVENLSTLNELIVNRNFEDLKWTCEGLHSKKLSKIATYLHDNISKKRVVTIAGPSSSNKTTFAKRLAMSLAVKGLSSVVIEMDDYFRNREDTPFNSEGVRDFESITALNVELLSERVHELLHGETIPRRKFDFKQGIGIDSTTEFLKLNENSILILEGIHGLNPILLNKIGRDLVTTIYVAPLTPLHIDCTFPFSTTDLRLIRRIIRDHKFRGFSARKTIRMWTNVRIGEEKNIFPYQCNADLFFNSALLYELPVLAVTGRALLAEATVPTPEEIENDPPEIVKSITSDARRILQLLNLFYVIPLDKVPHISCIREFMGGSDIKY